MTVNELIEVLRKFEGTLEVVYAVPATAFDCDAYSEDIDIEDVNEDTFEVDAKYNALIIKLGCMPDRCDWEHSCWWKSHNVKDSNG